MKQNPYAGLKKVILASMILVPLVPFVLAVGIGNYYFTGSLENNTIASIGRIVQDHRQMIESFLMERKADLDFIFDAYTFEDLNRSDKLQRTFENLQKQSHAFVDLGIFDENGLHVAYHGPYQLSGKVYDQAPWFKAVLKNKFYISNVFLGYRQVPHFVIAVARGNQGRQWVIRATIDTRIFNDLVKKVRIGKTGEAYLLDAKGVFQTERRSGGSLMSKDPDRRKYGQVHDGIKTFIDSDSHGESFLYATTWLKDKNWLLVVRQEKADAFKALRQASFLIFLISVLGGVTIVAVAFFLTDRIIRRMERVDREKNQLGEQLIRAGRLAELGEMAAGFAHEINNPLQIIKSEQALIETILQDLKQQRLVSESEDMTDLEDSIKQITLQVNRCSEITHSILKFGRKNEPEVQKVSLDQFIPEITKMVLKKAQVQGIAIQQHIADHTPPVFGDPAQLQQVLLNLCNNAIDAIYARHGSAGGNLLVEVGQTEDNMVRIQVSDNGCGIEHENLQKIFGPFFTTKPVGRGTGLGLSICFGIVTGMGGKMEVNSKPGEGTTFSVQLPIAN